MAAAVMTKRLKARRAEIADEMHRLLEDTFDATRQELGEDATDSAILSQPLTGDALAKHEGLCAEYDRVQAQLKVLDEEQDAERVAVEQSDLLVSAKASKRFAKLEAETFDTLKKMGSERYYNDRPPVQADARTWEMPMPLIARGSDGKNKVHPIRAIFRSDVEEGVDLEATFRHREILEASKWGEYDPVTGDRLVDMDTRMLSAAIERTDFAVPTMVTDLYRFMVNRNWLAQYCRIVQTDNLNNIQVNRRTAVPTAVIIGTAANRGESQAISASDSTYSSVVLQAWKYAFYTDHSYEALNSGLPWSITSEIARDGGIALANAIGAHMVTGSGATTGNSPQPQGVSTWIKATAAAQITGVARANFLAGTNAFDLGEMIKVLTSQPKEYMRSPSNLLLMRKSVYAGLLSLADKDGRALFFMQNDPNTGLPMSVIGQRMEIDENVDDASKANNIPLIMGDFDGMFLRYAGGPRIDYSAHVRFTNDEYRYRFIQHADARIVDTLTFRGYEVS